MLRGVGFHNFQPDSFPASECLEFVLAQMPRKARQICEYNGSKASFDLGSEFHAQPGRKGG